VSNCTSHRPLSRNPSHPLLADCGNDRFLEQISQ